MDRAGSSAENEGDDRLASSLAPNPPRWRLWLTRVTVFAVTFVSLIIALAALSAIVERFFIMLYTE